MSRRVMIRSLPPMMVMQSLCCVEMQAVLMFRYFHEAARYEVASFQMHLKDFIWFKIFQKLVKF